MGSIQVYYSGCRGGVGWVGWTWSYENSPLPSVIRRPVPKAMMVTSHCSNQGRGRFSRRPQNFVTLDSPCGVLSDSAKQLASSSSKLCILGLTEVKHPKVWPSLYKNINIYNNKYVWCESTFNNESNGIYLLLYMLIFFVISFLRVYKTWLWPMLIRGLK